MHRHIDLPTPSQIVSAAKDAIFGKPLVTNVHRSVLVESIVAFALPDWRWCSSDYASYDFRRGDAKLEVKQSAFLQTWSNGRLSRPAWDIAPRTGYWDDGATWVSQPGRIADIYVLALHQVADHTADHRDPRQWQFFVIPTKSLPPTKRIGLAAARQLTDAVPFEGLRSRIEDALVMAKHESGLLETQAR